MTLLPKSITLYCPLWARRPSRKKPWVLRRWGYSSFLFRFQ